MKSFIITLLIFIFVTSATQAQKAADSTMLTIFLKHQEDKNLKEINAKLDANQFHEMFPPKFARVVSWYVMMGIGQVVTLKFPADKLRELNLTLENGAWGAFNTSFYPTYDYMPVWKAQQQTKKP
ncbi:hypothetical protein HH214_20150 [Mucilaginibacter robiniae]|uniref:Uncharacterized protein n=2 Tax=Mucilaginibacter robiniae TaxID=2728022 RepID=A0A7L5EC29_9SPHI|nr:hypothetical protein HH214_20150 [Mucilaginibacter robiniae]